MPLTAKALLDYMALPPDEQANLQADPTVGPQLQSFSALPREEQTKVLDHLSAGNPAVASPQSSVDHVPGALARLAEGLPGLAYNFTVGPLVEAGRILREGRTSEQAAAFEAMTPEQRALYKESGQTYRNPMAPSSYEPLMGPLLGGAMMAAFMGKSPSLTMRSGPAESRAFPGGRRIPGLELTPSEQWDSEWERMPMEERQRLINQGPPASVPVSTPKEQAARTAKLAIERKQWEAEQSALAQERADQQAAQRLERDRAGTRVSPQADMPPVEVGRTLTPQEIRSAAEMRLPVPPSPTIPPELAAVTTGEAKAFLRPSSAEGTVPTVGEQALQGVNLKQYALQAGVGYYKSRITGAEVVFDPKQVTQSQLKAMDKQGILPDVVNGSGTSPKPAEPTTAVTARTPEGTEVRTVLTDTPEATASAVQAQSPSLQTEVKPSAEAVPQVLADRMQAIRREAEGATGHPFGKQYGSVETEMGPQSVAIGAAKSFREQFADLYPELRNLPNVGPKEIAEAIKKDKDNKLYTIIKEEVTKQLEREKVSPSAIEQRPSDFEAFSKAVDKPAAQPEQAVTGGTGGGPEQAVAGGIAKEPWQMTREEFNAIKERYRSLYHQWIDAEIALTDALEGVGPGRTGFAPTASKAQEIINNIRKKLPSWVTFEEGFDYDAYLKKALAAGEPVQVPSSSELPPVTGNQSQFYHGSGTVGLTKDRLNPDLTRIEGLFGEGIYLTDNPEIAAGYAKVRSTRTKTPVVYNAQVDPTAKILNLEEPVIPEFAGTLKKAAFSVDRMAGSDEVLKAVKKAIATPGSTNEQVYVAFSRAIEEVSHAEQIPISELSEIFQILRDDLKEFGYDALSYTGGKRTGKLPHRAVVVINPDIITQFDPTVSSVKPPVGVQPRLLDTQATMPPTPLQPKAPQVEHGELLAGMRPIEPPPPELPFSGTKEMRAGLPVPETVTPAEVSLGRFRTFLAEQRKKLPSELRVLREAPNSSVMSAIDGAAADVTNGAESIVTQPWAKALQRRTPQEFQQLESQAVRTWEQGGKTPEAMEQAISALPPDIQEMVRYRASRLPIEQAARRTLGLPEIPETPGPYFPRLSEHGLQDIQRLGAGGRLAGELQTTLRSFQQSRSFPTMAEGQAQGMIYADPRKAWALREWYSLKLEATAKLITNLEDKGVLFRTAEAAKAASPTGKAFGIEGLPGSPEWFASTSAEREFILQNLSRANRGALGSAITLGNQIFRNPNLFNPFPHFTKNMLYKFGLSGGSPTKVVPAMLEYERGSSPMVARFKQVFPAADTAQSAGQLFDPFLNPTGVTHKVLRAVGEINKPSSTAIFAHLDPALRYARWKQYIAKGMTDQEAANHVQVDLIRYGTRSDAVDFWKSIPLNFFVPWRTGTVTSVVKQMTSHPLRAAALIAGIDYLREARYRQSGRWTHLPIDYLESPIAQVVAHPTPKTAAAIAATTIAFGPGGASTASTLRDAIDDIRGGDEWGRIRNMFWGISQLYEIPKEWQAFEKTGDSSHLVNILSSSLVAEHSALNYSPRRLAAYLPEYLPGMQKSELVQAAEALQTQQQRRGEAIRARQALRPARTIEEKLQIAP